MFHGDQRTLTVFHKESHSLDWHFYTYDALSATQLCQGDIPTSGETWSVACWIYKDTLQFAVDLNTYGKLLINIYELQPTSSLPLHLLSSFPLLPQSGEFSFSPVSFHASFATDQEVIILDVQASRPLLQTKFDTIIPPGEFSPNGNFFALCGQGEKVYVWKNTPTGYTLWGSFRARSQIITPFWSPLSASLLCWSPLGIQLFYPDNSIDPLSNVKIQLNFRNETHIVACLTDGVHIATAKKQNNIITVLNYHSGTLLQSINTDMQIHDIKTIDDTIFVVDIHKLASWKLGSGGTTHSHYGTWRVAVDEVSALEINQDYSVLSHDCSQIAFTAQDRIFLYCVETQEILKSIKWEHDLLDMQFSPDNCELWLTSVTPSAGDHHFFMKLDTAVDWAIMEESLYSQETDSTWEWFQGEGVDIQAWSTKLASPHGCYAGIGSQWVTDSEGSKLLWLPPNWRIIKEWDMRWNNSFLTLLHYHHPGPIIIDFRPQFLPSHPD